MSFSSTPLLSGCGSGATGVQMCIRDRCLPGVLHAEFQGARGWAGKLAGQPQTRHRAGWKNRTDAGRTPNRCQLAESGDRDILAKLSLADPQRQGHQETATAAQRRTLADRGRIIFTSKTLGQNRNHRKVVFAIPDTRIICIMLSRRIFLCPSGFLRNSRIIL